MLRLLGLWLTLRQSIQMGSKERSNGTYLPINAEDYASSLAHVIKVENGTQDVVLGQAWVCGMGQMITCGHVVDAYVNSPNLLYVSFPLSGNRYPVFQIRLHPSFVRQPDQLVKFDAAMLTVNLRDPEITARPLPIVYEMTLPVQLALTAVRYPVHLGQFSSALNPLAQMGRLLGPLRKHDNFHLLHDLALSPGDSGAPIFGQDGSVVAIHCGDTATLPGLNLSTTSIRLSLWVDALRDLGVDGGTAPPPEGPSPSLALGLVKFALVFAVAFAITAGALVAPRMSALQVDSAKLKPVSIFFNKPRNGFAFGEQAEISLKPGSDCKLYLFDEPTEPGTNMVYRAFPQDSNGKLASVKAGESISIKVLGLDPLLVNDKQDKLHLFAVSNSLPEMKIGSSFETGDKGSLAINNRTALTEFKELKNKNPDDVIYSVIDGPVADMTLKPVQTR